ncbi:DUF493 family protein [Pseudomonas aeruginosa]|nr:DUF493 family protein [Pseudomonas aeruginosa]MCV6338971.1 DUF493 family protein [Pseudomonas aeruginosa]
MHTPGPPYPSLGGGAAGDGPPPLGGQHTGPPARHLDVETLVVRDSSKGRFLSVQVLITATDVDQLQAIHNDLRATGRVHMVL